MILNTFLNGGYGYERSVCTFWDCENVDTFRFFGKQITLLCQSDVMFVDYFIHNIKQNGQIHHNYLSCLYFNYYSQKISLIFQ